MAMHTESDQRGLSRHLDVVRRRWLVVAAMVATVVVVAVASSLTQTSRYRAEVEVDLRESAALTALGFGSVSDSPRSLANEVELAESDLVLAEARAQVGSEPRFNVRSHATADIIILAASSSDPAAAARAVDEYAAAFVAQRQDRVASELRAAADAISDGAGSGVSSADADLRARLVLAADLAEGVAAPPVAPAAIPRDASGASTGRTMAVAFFVGLGLGLAAAFVVERLDRSIRSEDDLLRAGGGIDCVGVIPELEVWNVFDEPMMAIRDHPDSMTAAAFRSLGTSLGLAARERALRIVAVTGPWAGVGATTTAANVALASARAGQRTVLIDASLRQPRVHEFFELANDVGFMTVLAGDAALEGAAHRIEDEPGLVVLTSGPPAADPVDLLAGTRASSLVKAVAGQADLVVLDIGPILDAAEAVVAAALVDAVLVVVSAEATTSDDVAASLDRLHRAERPVVGTVLNRIGAARGSRSTRPRFEMSDRSASDE